MAEFKIGRLRYTWKGYWSTNIFYNRDAIVAYNGKTYVCLEPHTSGSFYEDLEHYDEELGSTPYWTLMLDGTEWVGEWNPSTSYTLGNIVLYSGTLYQCIENHTSGISTIDLDSWKIYITVNSTWAGNYTPERLYKVGEVSKYNGIVYICIEEYTATSASTIDYSKWEILNVGIEYKSDWSGDGVDYRKNDIVKYGPDLWIATADHTSTTTFSETNWDLWIPGLEYGNTWEPAVIYQIGDVVKYGGYSYVNKITNNLNIVPSLNAEDSTSAWELLTTGYDLKEDWTPSTNYKIGDVVRRGFNTFVAVKDNVSQDPTDNSLSKTYVATGSNGLTVKLNNTTGLFVGMVLSGPGFDKGQFITKIINSTTIEISQAPYSTIIDGASISFTGINGNNWELLSASVRWRNRWEYSTTYIINDVVVWKNATYRCIKTHQSAVEATPDLDSAHIRWVLYINHDQYNVLSSSGDLIVNSLGTNIALSIGEEGFLLKSVIGVPTWSNVFRTPEVYYVAPSGTDLSGSGSTWDNPYKTIKYACSQIANGTLNIGIKQKIQDNKEFIVAETHNWVTYQLVNQNPPFALVGLIDIEKTKRDTRLLLDAIIYDISRGGNSQTVAFIYSYFDKEYSNQYATPEIASLAVQFIATISFIFETLFKVLNNINIAPLYQQLNNQTNILTQVIGILPEEQLIVDIQGFRNFILESLTNGNTNNIPPENQGLTATLMIKTGTYEEELPIVVPANTALVGDELRGVVVRPKLVINTLAVRTSAATNLITVKTTEGMTEGTPVQFASINPASQVNTVFGGLQSGVTYYVIGETITSTTFSVSETLGGPVVTLTNYASQMYVYGGDALHDMFYVQNGTGIRNMTLAGLLGTLSEPNEFTTRRPTGGAYVSLDPGTGPDDTRSWIIRKSPYVQNVTTFGIGSVGLKIDGNLHNGGNKSVVCNDFTQIISDGIGVWCTGPDSLCEAVSVFSYYAYAGYFSEAGGRIRATNGNSSYGTFGVVAEGFNEQETPITGNIDNRYYEATATPLSSLGANAEILKLQYSHAGENYLTETTNLLNYSNNFTNWLSDGNVTLIQSVISPSGQSNGWIATGNTSGTDSSYFYQDITIAPSGAIYTALEGDSQSGSGIGATFDIIVTSTQYIVTVNNPGSGYVTTNQIQINGSKLGGLDGVNDLIITVVSLSGTSISTISVSGTVQIGSTQPYMASIFCKKGTSPSVDIVATFSNYSTVSSGISYNFVSNEITPFNLTGGMIPETFSATPVYGEDGWYRLNFKFYDTTALNDSLQIRVYPRSRFGNSGYTLLYGAQLEVGNELGFYLKTSSERFTANANYDVIGAGSGVDLVGNEIRSQSVYQTRVLEVNGITGGTNYLVSTNNAQSGDETSIVIAQSDVAGEKDYLGMRLFVNSGAGAGQYGIVSSFDIISKKINILRESFDLVTVLASDASTDKFSLAESADINTLYVNQPVRFVPTNYTIDITNVSQNSLEVLTILGGTINAIEITSTARLAVNMPITFSGTTFGGVTSGFTYYVLSIIDDTRIQVSTTIGGAALLLNNSIGSMLLNYPSNTSYIVGDTSNMEVNLPIYFTGEVFSNVVAGQTYYINEIISSTEFTISSALAEIFVTETADITNYITVNDASSLRSLNPIIFTGTSVGGIAPLVKYYINHIIDSTHITVSTNTVDTLALSSMGSSNLITVNSTAGFIIGNPIVFTGTTFGGIINNKIYYVHYVNNDNTFSISNTSTLITIDVTETFATTNRIRIDSSTNLTPLNPIVFSGTAFGGLSSGAEYYISRIIDSTTITVSPSIISVEATETEGVSNLIRVSSTSGFVPNNPIIFGGSTFGGIVSGTVYYVSAINDAATFTISSTPGGSAVVLTAATGSMTTRTTSGSLILSNATGSLTGTTRYTGSAVDILTGVGECSVRTSSFSITLTADAGLMAGTSTVVKESLIAKTGTMTGTFSVPLFGGIDKNTTYYIKELSAGIPNTFSISETPSGAAVSLITDVGSMRMGETGWDHINSGTPLVSIFDSTTVYSIEPLITYSKPGFESTSNTNITPQPPGSSYVSIEYGNEKFVALPSSNLTLSVSTNGIDWLPQQLPTSASWKDLAYGNKYWVILSSGGTGISGSKVLYSNSNLVTWKTSYLPSVSNWSKIAYGNGKFVSITNDSSISAYSTDFGASWTSGTGLPDTTWSDLSYGNGRFVAVASGGTVAAVSVDGETWTASLLPRSTTWSSVKFGNGRFVAISSTSGFSAYSFDGETWYQSRYPVAGDQLSYGNGVFLATLTTDTNGYISEDGIVWFVKTVPVNVGSTTFGFDNANTGLFVGVYGQNFVKIVRAGAQTKARPEIYQEKIVRINEWEPGSNYTLIPTVTVTDSNAIRQVSVLPAIGNGVLANPTFYNKGTGYNTTSTNIVITGDGYAENYQVGLQLIFNSLLRLPSAGDNLIIDGDTTVYKVTDAVVLDGTQSPNIRAMINVSPSMSVARSPNHNTSATIRTKYSQVRLTNHDFLNIGYGNIQESNYPLLPSDTVLSPENEAVEVNYGRVFYSSTDQDGNFRVGKLFAVEQATGIVTLSASQFGLEGLSQLRLGGIAVGGNSVVITQFSTDSTFVANSNSIIPTQKAIKSYLTARLSQGGANTFTGQLIAGTVLIGGPDKISSTIPEGSEGSHVNIPVKANINGFEGGGWDGDGMALSYFMKSFNAGTSNW